MGCGGDKDTKEESTGGSGAPESGDSGDQGDGSSGTQGGGDEEVTLAKFLPGKRLYVEVDAHAPPESEFEEGPDARGSSESSEDRGEDTGEDPSEEKGETPIFAAGGAPPQKVFKAQFVMQFEKDGKCYAGMIVGGKIMGFDEDDGTTYKVSGPKKVTIYKDGKVDGGITFPTAHPKKGDKIKFDERDGQSEATITKIEDASPLATRGGGGDAPDPTAPVPLEPGDGKDPGDGGEEPAQPEPQRQTKEAAPDKSGNECSEPPTEKEKPTLADYLPSKRIVMPLPVPEGQQPPLGLNMQLLVQFEKDGTFTVGMVMNGKAMKSPGNNKRAMTYKVDKLEVAVLKNGKPDGGLIFSSATPKKDDKVVLTEKDSDKKFVLKIISIGKAGPLKDMPAGGPFGVAPEPTEDAKKAPPSKK